MLSLEEVKSILAHGLIDLILSNKDIYEKSRECGAIGLVIHLEPIKKDYIFKYELDTCDYGLIEIKFGSLDPNSIIFYHDNNEDVIVKAALYGDGIIDEDELHV